MAHAPAPARILARLLLVVLLAPALAGCLATPAATVPPPEAAPVEPAVTEARLTPEDQAASEVTIAADPTDPARLVAAANSGGGFGVYRTSDAGATWAASTFTAAQVAPLPGGAPRFRSLSDPALAFAPDGTLYLAGLAYIPTSAVFVAESRDGGATWGSVHVVEESDLASSFNDKEWLGVNPVTGTLVLSWQKEPAMDQLRGVDERAGTDVDFGDVVVARSTDGGATWSKPVKVSAGAHSNGTQVAFTPDGRAHLLWVNYETSTLDHAVSTDDGATWSPARAVVPITYPAPLPRYARMHTLPALAASPVSEALYAVWHDNRNGDIDVYAAASADGGATWGPPVRVNDDPIGNGVHQMYPWAAVGPDGRLHVTFYDSREEPEHPRFRFWHATAAGPELAFEANRPVSTEPFTAFTKRGLAPGQADDERRNFGDYTGLAATSLGVFPAWMDGRHERESVYAARISSAPVQR